MSNDWKEYESKRVHLREQQPCTFKVYSESVYANGSDLCQVAVSHAEDLVPADERDNEDDKGDELTAYALFKTWVLGDFLSDVGFKNRVMKCIIQAAQDKKLGLCIAGLTFAFDNSPSDSGLQKFVTDLVIPVLTEAEHVDRATKKISQHCVAPL